VSDVLSVSTFEWHLTEVENADPGERNPSIRALLLHDETQRMLLAQLVTAAKIACDVIENADEHVRPETAAYSLKVQTMEKLRRATRLAETHW
jgi:hypothetical protein